jgi:hypothetical protein
MASAARAAAPLKPTAAALRQRADLLARCLQKNTSAVAKAPGLNSVMRVRISLADAEGAHRDIWADQERLIRQVCGDARERC